MKTGTSPKGVLGHRLDAPRLTPLGAALVSLLVAVPGGAIVALCAALLF